MFLKDYIPGSTEYSHRVPTSIFVEIIQSMIVDTGVRVRIYSSVETSPFSSMPELENFLKAKIIIEVA